jgi:hypothetical protein
MGEMKMHTKFWLDSRKETDHSEDLNVDRKGTFKWCSGNKVCGCGMDLSGSGQRLVIASCEKDNELSGSTKRR